MARLCWGGNELRATDGGDPHDRGWTPLRRVVRADDPMSTAIARRWPIVAFVTGLALLGAALGLAAAPSTYQATATLQVPTAAAVSANVRADDLAYTDRLLNTYKHLLELRDVRDRIARTAGLAGPADVAVTIEPNTELLQVAGRAGSAELARRVADAAARLLVDRASQTARPTGSALAAAEARQRGIETKLTQLQKRYAGALDPGERAGLRQAIKLQELDYQALSGQVAQLATAGGGTGRSLAVVDAATAPSAPVAPSRKLIVTLALLLGLGAGGAVALIAERRAPRAATVGELERATGAPVIAVVPAATHAEPAGVFNGGSPHQEAFGVVRARLLAFREEGTRTILVTSATRGAGKSVVAANVAAALSAAQRRVVLIDLDLRTPSVHELLPGGEGPGAAAVLSGDDAIKGMLDGVLRRDVRPNLDVLAGGPPTSEAAELLASPRLGELLRLVQSDHAFVILDAPALDAISDAASIASKVDEALLVVGGLPADQEEIRQTCARLEGLGVRHVGLVVNGGRRGMAAALRGSWS
jgi:capsular exopolysaccharide synthesis family protein